MLHWFAKRLREVQEKDKNGEKGFTLIELLVVVIIIGILAAIAIPTFLSQRQNAKEADAESTARNYATGAKSWLADTDSDNYTGINAAAVQGVETALPTDIQGAAAITVAAAAGDADNFVVTVPFDGGTATFTSVDGQIVVT